MITIHGEAVNPPKGTDDGEGNDVQKILRSTLHATRERDQKIAAGMGKEFAATKKSKATSKSTCTSGTAPKRSGTQRARDPKRVS